MATNRISRALARWLDRWIERADKTVATESATPTSWILASIFICSTLPLLAYEPHLRALTELRLVPALICFAPAALLGIGIGFAPQLQQTRLWWVLYLVGSAYTEFFCASLVAFCRMPSAAFVASLFLLSAAAHGHVGRASLSMPFVTIGTILAGVGGMLLNTEPAHLAVLGSTTVAAVVAQLFLGRFARRGELGQRRVARLQEALAAQMLDERSRQVERLAATLTEVMGKYHDANNALSALRLAADAMRVEVKGKGEAAVILGELEQAVHRVQQIFEEGRQRHGVLAESGEMVDVAHKVEALGQDIVRRFPSVKLEFDLQRDPLLEVCLLGGEVTLDRVVTNLLINACEGDGKRAASRVKVSAQRDTSGADVRLVISDDGPGFAPAQLQKPIEGFATSKPDGTGLGLYTSERLLRANSGTLVRSNLPTGGAQVAVTLPLVRR